MEADLITAPGDGLGPAILLTLGTRLKAQYLFNIPEGFSRFVLEHKIRPGLGLRAAFLSDLLSATGVSGLIMRLRGEGHGQLEIFGPSGTLPFVASLRHFVHWRHPAISVTEMEAPPAAASHEDSNQSQEESQFVELYSDEHIAIIPLWSSFIGSDDGSRDWKLPIWLRNVKESSEVPTSEGQEQQKKQKPPKAGLKAKEGSESSSTSDDDSDSRTTSVTSSDDCTTSSSDSDTSSTEDDEDVDIKKKKITTSKDNGMFAALDAAFMSSKPSGVRKQALGLMRPQTTQQGGDASGTWPLSLSLLSPQAGPSGAREVFGRVYTPCNAPGISLFSRNGQIKPSSGTINATIGAAAGRGAKPTSGAVSDSGSLLGFLCYIRATNQVLVVAHCHTFDNLKKLQEHPAASAVSKLPQER